MTTDPTRTPYCTKIRYGIDGTPIIDGDEMDGSYAPGVGVQPVLIELVYSAALKDRPASVAATVTGLWTRFGVREEPERTVATHFRDGPDGWPQWLAAEARLHDPDARAAAGPAPATDQAALVDQVAVLTRATQTLLADIGLRETEGEHALAEYGRELVALLRRLADETPQPEWSPPPPGDTREQLPNHLLELLDMPLYLSTACQTEGQLRRRISQHGDPTGELAAWAERLDARCRHNQKFTGQLCICPVHTAAVAQPDEEASRG